MTVHPVPDVHVAVSPETIERILRDVKSPIDETEPDTLPSAKGPVKNSQGNTIQNG